MSRSAFTFAKHNYYIYVKEKGFPDVRPTFGRDMCGNGKAVCGTIIFTR